MLSTGAFSNISSSFRSTTTIFSILRVLSFNDRRTSYLMIDPWIVCFQICIRQNRNESMINYTLLYTDTRAHVLSLFYASMQTQFDNHQ